jgi:ABC-2 type transport system permease protein
VQVSNGVAIEKSNRISEVLLAIVRPRALLLGKVLGVAAIGLLTVTAALVPVLASLALGGDLPDGLGPAVFAGAAWSVLGLLLYLTLAGALGALVERQEEAGSAVSPLMAVLIGTFVAVSGNPDSTLGTVLAYIPFTSPLVEPARLAMGVSSPAEVAASLVLGAAAVAVAARLAGTVYARAVVRTGRRLKLREVL